MSYPLTLFSQEEIDLLLQAQLVELVDSSTYQWTPRGRHFVQSVMGLLTGSGLRPLNTLTLPENPPDESEES